ncbi:hypothetical protein BST81_15835 [Leptolyngbya sp. 'hensonii']|uniref:DUF305 domain-containing protein n=1 Tax=Leptolyngbya sp. 'hensonii' TaxID=1922337 RepID=UPI00094F5FE8|nr:DUF305 domain-containing protein [Leptolyngbya sp. 'hensonii']OLP17468.1 hypothetical protein BST81_15835 [Leptolyngbya sp. 'hensonii']
MNRNLVMGGVAGLFIGSIAITLTIARKAPLQATPAFSDRSLAISEVPLADPDRSPPGSLGMMAQVEQHFILMMIPHHQAAIAMAELALSQAQHPEIRALAQSIRTTQTQENHQMRTWYQQWYGTEIPDWVPGMGRGRFSSPGAYSQPGRSLRMGMMPSSKCRSLDLEALKTAPDFDQTFLEKMILHHRMGVRMAQMVLSQNPRPEIRDLAQAIVKTQTREIEQMQQWYLQWYRKTP